MERFYSGAEGRVVVRDGEQSRPLDLRLDLDRDGQGRFTWGPENTGNRLAVALLSDAIGDDQKAVSLADAFTERVIGMLPARWTMSRARVLSFVDIIIRQSLENVSQDQQASPARHIERSASREKRKTEPNVGER